MATAYVIQLARVMPSYGTDVDPIRLAARLLLRGEDTYAAIGPGLQYKWTFRLLYPLPAVLLGIPFASVPVTVARGLFVAVSSGAMAYVATRRSWWPLLAVASASWSAVALAQWSPLLFVAGSVPTLGFVLAAKPNAGVAILAGARAHKAMG